MVQNSDQEPELSLKGRLGVALTGEQLELQVLEQLWVGTNTSKRGGMNAAHLYYCTEVLRTHSMTCCQDTLQFTTTVTEFIHLLPGRHDI